MTRSTTWLACCAIAYLLGAIPFGLIIARARGIDIRAHGSGNIGATNVFRCVGRVWGSIALILDALKGFIPVFAAGQLPASLGGTGDPLTLQLLCAAAAVAGHVWPVYLRFKGGKGVATSAGALFGIVPAVMTTGLAAWLLVALLTRYVSLASISAAAVIAAAGWYRYSDVPAVPATLTLLAALTIWRHRTNVRRLLNGTENKIGQRVTTKPASQAGSTSHP